MHKTVKWIFVVVLLLSVIPISSAMAQSPIKCGDVFEGEFLNESEIYLFSIDLTPGDRIQVSAKPFGDTLKIALAIYTPTGKFLTGNQGNGLFTPNPDRTPALDTGIVGGRGTYKIVVANSEISNGKASSSYQSGTGPFTVYFGCTLKDGTTIKPGDTVQPASQPGNNNNSGTSSNTPPFSGNGFPGLAPVDFSRATKLKLPRSGEIEGEITPQGGEVLGFTFDATGGQQFDLSFVRTKGNLNLGLVILSEDNKVYFQTSLVASSELTTKLMLPAGKYTLGIFKIDLVAPTAAEATEFAITLK